MLNHQLYDAPRAPPTGNGRLNPRARGTAPRNIRECPSQARWGLRYPRIRLGIGIEAATGPETPESEGERVGRLRVIDGGLN